MNKQMEQTMLVVESLADSLNGFVNDMRDELYFLEKLDEYEDDDEQNLVVYKDYLKQQRGFTCDILWHDENELKNGENAVITSFRGIDYSKWILITELSNKQNIWQCSGNNGQYYLLFEQHKSDGKYIGLVIDEEKYYEYLMQDLHIGTNGYVALKSYDGQVIMHPDRNMWGLDIIEGRQELYSEVNLTSVNEMIKKQRQEPTGFYEYDSYWWESDTKTAVRKICGHVWLSVGQDIWIVSGVVDYDDLYAPIIDGLRNMVLIFAGILFIFLIMIALIGQLIVQDQRILREIEYLEDLNQKLEEIHKGEELLQHQQRLQVMGAMTGGIAHEFNNFLTPILGFSEILLYQLPETSDEYDSVIEIRNAAERAGEVVRQISSMSRKNIETVYQVQDAGKLLSRVRKMCSSVCPDNITITVENTLTDQTFFGNGTQINQVLLNIFVNAVQAIGNKECGEIILRGDVVDADKMKLISDFDARNWEQYIHLQIDDNGCGMDPTTLRHIFEPFYTTKKMGTGTGLGLSLAQQIVDYHRGMICADSVKGEGSSFHIYLPIIGEEFTEENNSTQLTISNRNILIADDNQKILRMLLKAFGKLGINAEACTTRKELEEILDRQDTNVLFIDETMSDVDAMDFCMSMEGKYRDVRRIVMIDMLNKEIIEAKQRKIIDDYLMKPVSAEHMVRAIVKLEQSVMMKQ